MCEALSPMDERERLGDHREKKLATHHILEGERGGEIETARSGRESGDREEGEGRRGRSSDASTGRNDKPILNRQWRGGRGGCGGEGVPAHARGVLPRPRPGIHHGVHGA